MIPSAAIAQSVMETELKFQVPRGQRGALCRALQTVGARSTRLQAVYADTAAQHLAAAGMALRLRKEGRVWVQTLKGRGDGLARRFEHEAVLHGVRGLPQLNAALHDGTALAPALAQALRLGGALTPVYRTDIQRLHVRQPFQGAVIELALDRGHLIAGDLKARVHEIEFELISGPPTALPTFAADWALRHGLWWDVRTKSERGFGLAQQAQGRSSGPPAPMLLPAAPAAADLASTLVWVLAQAAVLADGRGCAADVTHFGAAVQRLSKCLASMDLELAALVADLGLGAQPLRLAPSVVRGPGFTTSMLRVLRLAMAVAPT